MNKMKLIPLSVMFSAITFANVESPLPKPTVCLSTREFITTLEYLRAHKEFSLTGKLASEIAHKVAGGCSNASKRFINVTDILVKAEVPSQKAVETAIKFAHASDTSAGAFLSIFKGAFVSDLLDLDVGNALEIALELSHDYKGNTKIAEKEFNRLVSFCVSKKALDLPLMKCAKIASRVVKSGEMFDFEIGKAFIDIFEFLHKENVSLSTFQSLDTAEYVVKYGPKARENFIQAYEYAVSARGFHAPMSSAIEFGKSLAAKSYQLEKDNKI